MLPLAAGHDLVLDRLLHLVRKPEQQRRVLVVDVGCLRAAPEVGHVAVEVETAARARAEFRLPVIEPQAVDGEAEAELVAAVQLCQVRRQRVGLLVAERRRPVVVVAERAEPVSRSGACRHTAGRCARSSRRWFRECRARRCRSCPDRSRHRRPPGSSRRSRTSRQPPSSG